MSSGTESSLPDREGSTEADQRPRVPLPKDHERETTNPNRPQISHSDGVLLTPVDAAARPLVGQTHTWDFVYNRLARQIEYYFSDKNLSKDTYLQTLKRLNDGCVPLSILANFTMVKRLISSFTAVESEQGRQAAVQEAVRNYSDILVLHLVDTNTGLRVPPDSELKDDTSRRISAVGTVDDKPVRLESMALAQPSPIVKTVVLRDVAAGVTPEEIHALFSSQDFPPVTNIQPDVANCWFVTLDTEDKDVMLNLLLSLRSMTLRDQPVHARLKSTVAASAVDTAPVMPWFPPVPPEQGETATKNKKKKIRGRKKKASPARIKKKGESQPEPALPPTLGEDNFPTLQQDKVEWEIVGEKCHDPRQGTNSDEEEFEDIAGKEEGERRSVKTVSDGASTATTTSSSLESVPKKTLPAVGYAAALMGKTKGPDC